MTLRTGTSCDGVRLNLTPLTWTKWRAPTNASKWRMGFNSAFKGLTEVVLACSGSWPSKLCYRRFPLTALYIPSVRTQTQCVFCEVRTEKVWNLGEFLSMMLSLYLKSGLHRILDMQPSSKLTPNNFSPPPTHPSQLYQNFSIMLPSKHKIVQLLYLAAYCQSSNYYHIPFLISLLFALLSAKSLPEGRAGSAWYLAQQ